MCVCVCFVGGAREQRVATWSWLVESENRRLPTKKVLFGTDACFCFVGSGCQVGHILQMDPECLQRRRKSNNEVGTTRGPKFQNPFVERLESMINCHKDSR